MQGGTLRLFAHRAGGGWEGDPDGFGEPHPEEAAAGGPAVVFPAGAAEASAEALPAAAEPAAVGEGRMTGAKMV